MNNKEKMTSNETFLKNNASSIPYKIIKQGEQTKKLIYNLDIETNTKKLLTKNKIDDGIEDELKFYIKSLNNLKIENKKNTSDLNISKIIVNKINSLCDAWFLLRIDVALLNWNEKNIYSMRPSISHFLLIIFNKVNSIFKNILKKKINIDFFLSKLNDNAVSWALSKISNRKLSYKLKIKKFLYLILALESKDYKKYLFLLNNTYYRYIIDYPSSLESVFESRINISIFQLEKFIKFSRDPNGLISNRNGNLIDVKNGYKIYSSRSSNTSVLKDINLEIKQGEFVLLLGPSGSGKTTLMNCLAGIDQLSFGDIVFDDINITKLTDHSLTEFRMKSISYVFQHFGLLPNLNVEENILVGDFLKNKNFSWKIRKDNHQRDEKFIETLMNDFGITNEKEKMPYELSGGQQQRVAIARAISKRPKILFADEPTSALDEKTGETILKFLVEANVKYRQTIVMITHNEKITHYASRIIKLKDGRIIENKIKEKNYAT